MYLTEKDKNRFWSKVNKRAENECWEWLGCKQFGYGIININKKTYRANRISYLLSYNNLPDDMFICHKCNNRACCNPNHLYAGTAKDNYLDTLNAGNFRNAPILHRTGEKAPLVKLTEIQVREIRELILSGVKHKEIANIYNISVSNVSAIGTNRSWNTI